MSGEMFNFDFCKDLSGQEKVELVKLFKVIKSFVSDFQKDKELTDFLKDIQEYFLISQIKRHPNVLGLRRFSNVNGDIKTETVGSICLNAGFLDGVVEYILKHEIGGIVQDKETGRTLGMHFVASGREDMGLVAIQNENAINIQDNEGNTIGHMAAIKGMISLINKLLNYDCATIQNNNGYNMGMLCAQRIGVHTRMEESYIQSYLNETARNQRNTNGETMRDIALSRGFKEENDLEIFEKN